jgi:hypothetical protein
MKGFACLIRIDIMMVDSQGRLTDIDDHTTIFSSVET